MHGLTPRLTSDHIPVLRLHYSSDPDKQPGTELGEQWRAQQAQGYPGGLQGPRWQKEMEIQYGAMGGTKCFPEWEQWISGAKIVIPHFEPHGYKLYGSFDHGWRNPACYLVAGIDYDGNIVMFWEAYGSFIPYDQMAKVIHGQPGRTRDRKTIPGNPHHGKEMFKLADPSIWAEDRPMADETMKSIAHLYSKQLPNEERVYFTPAERGGDTTVVEWLTSHFWADPQAPSLRITTACPNLIKELGKLQFKDVSANACLTKDAPEQLVDKDNHAWDAMKQFLLRFPPKHARPKPEEKPCSFAWWQKQVKAAKTGDTIKTYKREMVG